MSRALARSRTAARFFFKSSGGKPAQPVVAAERDDQHAHIAFERPIQPAQAAGRRIARHTGIDHFVVEAFVLQLLADQRWKTLVRRQTQARGQTVAEKDNARLALRRGAVHLCTLVQLAQLAPVQLAVGLVDGARGTHAISEGHEQRRADAACASRDVDHERRGVVGRAARDRFVRRSASRHRGRLRARQQARQRRAVEPAVHAVGAQHEAIARLELLFARAGLHIVLGADHAGQHVTQRMCGSASSACFAPSTDASQVSSFVSCSSEPWRNR